MRFAVLAAVTMLTGCATTPAGLAESGLDLTLTSTKSPKDWAQCALANFHGMSQIDDDGTNWWIISPNGFGVPIQRWDFKPTPTGSIAELRSTTGVATGKKIVANCA